MKTPFILILLCTALTQFGLTQSAEELNELSIKYYKNGNLDSSMIFVDQAISMDSNSHTGYFNKGLIYLDRNDTQNASKQFKKALEKNPNHISSLLNYGQF